jgi:signal transduction histidine kinase
MLQSDEIGKLNKKQKEYLEEIYKGSKRMVKLVNNLLNISRIETGLLLIEPEMVNLVSFIKDTIHEVEPWDATLEREVVFEKPDGLLPMVPIDPMMMRQVIQNIVTNAIRYSPQSKNSIKVLLEKKDDKYVISVSDDGIGIPKEDQERIFEKFFRADNAREVISEGSGIGMYISKMVTEASGGNLWFESPTAFKKIDGKEVGYGTTFYISIPISGMKKHEGEKKLV